MSTGLVAHLVERLICTEEVAGSSPVESTNKSKSTFLNYLTFYYMTVSEFKMLNEEETLFIDIRESYEFASIPSPESAVHIPMEKMIEEANKKTLPKDKKIVTICHSGARTFFLHAILIKNGYDADYIEGGLLRF